MCHIIVMTRLPVGVFIIFMTPVKRPVLKDFARYMIMNICARMPLT